MTAPAYVALIVGAAVLIAAGVWALHAMSRPWRESMKRRRQALIDADRPPPPKDAPSTPPIPFSRDDIR